MSHNFRNSDGKRPEFILQINARKIRFEISTAVIMNVELLGGRPPTVLGNIIL
jgi:hypothetical protein